MSTMQEKSELSLENLSTTEPEYMVLSEATKQPIFVFSLKTGVASWLISRLRELYQQRTPKLKTAQFFPYGVTGFFILQLLDAVSGEPRGVAVFSGGRGGRVATTSDEWGVLSPTTKVLVGIFCLIIAILVGIGLYRFYKWCHKPPA